MLLDIKLQKKGWPIMSRRKNREFVLLAKIYDPKKHSVGGWYLSEKYDGQRCFWDGGISRGKPKIDVPWANNSKDERYVEEQICTGLWTRYANVIHAPGWFLDELPIGVCLDGELYMGRGRFQETRRVVSTLEPGSAWSQVSFIVFDSPSPQVIFQDGRINNSNFKKQIKEMECRSFFGEGNFYQPTKLFQSSTQTLKNLSKDLSYDHIWYPCLQHKLPSNEEDAQKAIQERLQHVSLQGGEGLMLRDPISIWAPIRTSTLLKVKKINIGKGIVTGYVWGEKGKEGKLFGYMGSVTVKWKEKIFQVSGFTEDERFMCGIGNDDYISAISEGQHHPGEEVIGKFYNKKFPRGSELIFKYTVLTDDGYPREARYCR